MGWRVDGGVCRGIGRRGGGGGGVAFEVGGVIGRSEGCANEDECLLYSSARRSWTISRVVLLIEIINCIRLLARFEDWRLGRCRDALQRTVDLTSLLR